MNKPLSLLSFALLAACAPPEFEPQSHVRSVRVLAIAADRPYAPPGARVNLSLLAVDGRASRREPMRLYFVPEPCFNPTGDAYYACFARFAERYPRGSELDSLLSAGDHFAFTLPEDIIVPRQSSAEPYGLTVVFAMACAGHVQYEPPPPGGSPDAVPFACRDAAGQRLGADDFVFAYATVYSFAARSNTNPEIQALTFAGAPLDAGQGITMPVCAQQDLDDCPPESLDVTLAPESIEPDPGDLDSAGNVLGEQIYVSYYLTAGKLKNDSVILADPRRGRLGDTANELRAPARAGEHQLWVVVRDNRGGVSWQELAFHVYE